MIQKLASCKVALFEGKLFHDWNSGFPLLMSSKFWQRVIDHEHIGTT